MDHSEILVRFFRGIGSEREAEMYLKLFRRSEPNRFALIEVAEDLSPFSLHLLALNLAFLSSLDLVPIVIHGPGTTVLHDGGHNGRVKVDGDFWGYLAEWPEGDERADLTPQKVRDATLAINESLTNAILLHEGNAVGVESGVFRGESPSDLSIRTAAITTAIRSRTIPVVAALAKGPESRRLIPVPLALASKRLAERIGPRKYIRVCETGGLLRTDGSVLDYINLTLDAGRFSADSRLTPAAAQELARARDLLEVLPARSVVEYASAENLLRELFTQKGGGTLIKPGRALQVHTELQTLARSRLRKLIETAFGKSLARDYFVGRYSRRCPIRSIIIDPDYKGVAIVRKVSGLTYLDKFAVRPEARGEGIANDLWTVLLRRHPRFFWRSRRDNPINPWYYERATGMVKVDEWNIWWRGLTPGQARKAIRYAREIRPTLK